jgi:glutaredoxin
MTKPEQIQKFAEMLAAPDGTAWTHIKEKNNEREYVKGKISRWKSYDVQMIYVEDGQLREVYWDFVKGVRTSPVAFHTDDLPYISEFVRTNRAGILDAFDKFFYDGREARSANERELKEAEAYWREDNKELLHFINE